MKIERHYSKHRDPRGLPQHARPSSTTRRHRDGGAHLLRQAGGRARTCCESATLVGMLKGTSYYNPVRNPGARAGAPQRGAGRRWCKHGVLDRRSADQRCARAAASCDFERQAERTGRGAAFHGTRAQVAARMGRRERPQPLHRRPGGAHHARLAAAGRRQRRRWSARRRAAGGGRRRVGASRPCRRRQSSAAVRQACAAAVAAVRLLLATKPRPAATPSSARRRTYRQAVAGGAAPAAALAHAARRHAPSWRAARARRPGWRPASSRSTRPAAKCGPGSAAATSQRDQFDHVAQAAAPARAPPSSPSSTARRWSSGMSPEQRFHRQRGGDPAGRRQRLAPDRHERRQRPADEPARGPGLFEEHHHRAGDAGRRRCSASSSWRRPMGVRQSKLDAVPSLALGTSPVTLLEMVGAYGTIAAQRRIPRAVFVQRIKDRDGKVLAEFGTAPRSACCRARRADRADRHDARRGQPRHRHRRSAAASASAPTSPARPAPRRTIPTAGSS